MKIKLDTYGKMPTRKHATDAGLDLYAADNDVIFSGQSTVFRTGVHVQLPSGTVGFIKSRSGLMVNHGITTDGVVDEGFTGEIKVALFNHGTRPYQVNRGDRIAQLVVLKTYYVDCEQVDELDDSERGDNGYGSTGR